MVEPFADTVELLGTSETRTIAYLGPQAAE